MNSKVSFFRFVATVEGISFLILLLIAMPLKYWMDQPLAVRYVGMAHGVLFLLYIPALLLVAPVLKWGVLMTFRAFLASLLPGGTFLLDRQIVKDWKEINSSANNS
ncbi:MAG: DUF3817 domain-containing protein [Imperialibacter sp.]|uniref:DUF3817 domain-containing protein n=1 Tax=Imperialibacter sp. TaxID=2038411 RepID=UPI0032F00149